MRYSNQNTNQDTRFEYKNLPAKQRASIQKLTLEIKENLQKTVYIIWEIGSKLVEVRSQLDLWQFSSYLQLEFAWSRRTAYNFINVYEAFPEFSRAKFARLDISISALYLLAAPSTPSAIRQHFLDRALAGEHVSYKAVQTSIVEARTTPTDRERLTVPEMLVADDVCEHPLLLETQPSATGYLSSEVDERTVEVHNSDRVGKWSNWP
jgi:Protein of unknown function (DUF3102)